MKDFSRRAIDVFNGVSHFHSDPARLSEAANQNWQYKIEFSGDHDKKFKILTLQFCCKLDKVTPIELIILEAFSSLVESRYLDQVFSLTFKELESFLRDFNNIPAFPDSVLDHANYSFEVMRLDFLTFLLINEFSKESRFRIDVELWPNMTLSEKVSLLNNALQLSHKYYGNLMPSRLISVSTSEVVFSYPEKHLPVSELVLDHFLKSLGVKAGLKLVAV